MKKIYQILPVCRILRPIRIHPLRRTGRTAQDDVGSDYSSGSLNGNGRYEDGENSTTGGQEKENPSSAGNDSDKKYAGKILVIADTEGSISVLRYDKNGSVTSREKTTIDLSMLTETDQKLFEKGIALNDDSELSELLQDFEG